MRSWCLSDPKSVGKASGPNILLDLIGDAKPKPAVHVPVVHVSQSSTPLLGKPRSACFSGPILGLESKSLGISVIGFFKYLQTCPRRLTAPLARPVTLHCAFGRGVLFKELQVLD